jgi:hypothetical protein
LNSLLATLIDILRVSASLGENHNTLRVAPARDILVDICSHQVPQSQIDQLADALEACAAGRSAALPSLALIEPAFSNPESQARLVRASAALNEMLLLHHALHAEGSLPTELAITNLHFFDYLQTLQISSAPNHARVVLVGALLPTQSKVEMRFEAGPQLLRRITLSYAADSPYPLLDLQLWSASQSKQSRAERQEYQQPDAQHDLNVWTRDNRSSGSIRTRLVPLPCQITTQRMCIHIHALAGLALVETSVLDSQGTTIARCLRMARHAAR